MSIDRREFLFAGGGFLATTVGAALPGAAWASSRRRARLWARPDLSAPAPDQLEALRVLGKSSLRMPESRPFAALPAGTDTMPAIEHVVVAMMENHSYDNFLGMLGRGPFERPRGDGFTIAADGWPADWNPQADGTPLRAFRMPATCQRDVSVTQEWVQCHVQYANGTNQGFVRSGSGVSAMGYWDSSSLPFTYGLASVFPIGDRYFSSVLGQTDPNRRYLIAATSSGMTDDIPDPTQDATLLTPPAGGTIFNRLTEAGISWKEYAEQTGATSVTENLYPANDYGYNTTRVKPFSEFFNDAAAGTLPSFSLLDPNFSTQSQENPQNIVLGEAWLRSVVEALGASPKWRQTVLIINYDEHGGYYDHVPPPAALAPDRVAPVVQGREPLYDGFRRYGFRVPCIVVSPYAKTDYVSHVVYDHTSVLAFVERKWNLPAMTLRDANANDLTDFLDLEAMAAGRPTFPELPALPASGDTPAAEACSSQPGVKLPPPRPAPLPVQARISACRVDRARNALLVPVQASRPVSACAVELWRGHQRVAHRHLESLGVAVREVPLRAGRHAPGPGHYEVVVRQGTAVLARRAVRVGG